MPQQSGETHRASRIAVAPILSSEALKIYLPTIEKRTEAYVQELLARGETFLAKDLTDFCLQLFAELFSGHS